MFKNKKRKSTFNLLQVCIVVFVITVGVFYVYNYSRALIFERAYSESGLVGHWTMDQSDYISSQIQDKTIYNHDATNYGGTFTTDRFGVANKAMYLSSDYLQISNPLSSQANLEQEWTVSVWVDVSNNDDQYLIYGMNKGVKLTHSTTNKPLLYLNSDTNDYYIYGDTADLLESQGWKHVVFVFKNSTGLREIYVDGVNVSGIGPNKTSIPSGISSTLKIGYSSVMKIDDLKIFNKALSASEIQVLYSGNTFKTSLGTKRKGLILDMPLVSEYTKRSTTGSEILTDKTPRSHDGQNTGTTVSSDGVYFDSSTEHISIPSSPELNEVLFSSIFTISTWIKPTSWVNYGTISKGVSYSWSHSSNSLWSYSAGLRCVMGDGDISHSNVSGSYVRTDTDMPALNEWHHVVCKGDGTNLKMYVDGALKSSTAISGLTYTRKTNNNPLVIGGRTETISNGLRGTVRNLKIYDRAITDDELLKLFEEKVEKKTQVATLKGNLILDMPLKSDYTKTETTGSEILTDRTPYSNDGQNHGVTILEGEASFDGVNDYIEANSVSNDLANSSVTFSYWMKTTATTNLHTLSFNTSTGSNTFLLGIYNGNANSYDGGHHVGSISIADNAWHHVVVTINASTSQVVQYIDGQQDVSYTTSKRINSDDRFSIGQEWDSDILSQFFLGQISNVLLYSKALSADEVESLYSKGRGY